MGPLFPVSIFPVAVSKIPLLRCLLSLQKHPIAYASIAGPCAVQATVMDAVVKIFCVHTEPNYSLPWQRKRQYASTSSGFIIAGENGERWLLTNAHSVEYFSQVGSLV